MNDPTRMREENGEAKALLSAARRPRSLPAEVRARSAARVAAMVAVPTVAGVAGWRILAKKILGLATFTAVGAGIGLAAWTYVNRGDRVRVEPATTSEAPQTTATSDSKPPPQPSAAAPIAPATSASATNVATVSASKSAPTPSASTDLLAAETELLDAARAKVDADPAGALVLLDAHRAKFPNGKLSAEREYLSVRALSRLGRTAEAKARADAFLQRWPDSPLADVVRRLVE